jgi:hypothetical protein
LYVANLVHEKISGSNYKLDKIIWGGFQKIVCTQRLKFARCTHLFCTNTLTWHHAFATCTKFIAFSSQIWVRSTLYGVRPSFTKSTPDLKVNPEKTELCLPYKNDPDPVQVQVGECSISTQNEMNVFDSISQLTSYEIKKGE